MKKSNFKAKKICVIMTFILSVLIFLAGLWQLGIYKKLKNNCTCTTTGVIVNEAHYTGERKSIQEHIEVKTDQYFNKGTIYASNREDKKGDKVIIHYDKDDPDSYYINDRVDEYKDAAVFIFVISIFMFMLTVFLAVVIRKQMKKSQEKTPELFFNE